MSLERNPRQYMGVRAILPPDLQKAKRDPGASDVSYVIGTLWLNTVGDTVWMFAGPGVWIALGSGATGGVVTLTGDSGGAIIPLAGNINVLGTANQITSVGSGHTITWSIPTTFIAPGSIASTTTIHAGTALSAATTITATLGAITATNGNFVFGTAGNKTIYNSVASNATAGANSAGKVTLVGGTATIATTAVTANSLIRISRQSIGATGAASLGWLTIGTITAATSFVINSVTAANATALQTSDVSIVFWEIVN